MQYIAHNIDLYLKHIDQNKLDDFKLIRNVIKENLPQGFVEDFQYQMIAYVVPLSIYPSGYHAKPNTPLPFLSLAAQKHSINLYHFGIYQDQTLYDWFLDQYEQIYHKKPDMGKSCIRLKKVDKNILGLIGDLVTKISVEDMISLYEKHMKKE